MRLMSAPRSGTTRAAVGDSACASAMLSKLALIVSSGSHFAGIDVEVEQVLMARSYSGRFRRWNVRRPGFGFAAAAVSTVVSSAVISARYVASSGLLRTGRRHHARLQLDDDLLGDLGVLDRLGHVACHSA
jgi:hypothetical protein